MQPGTVLSIRAHPPGIERPARALKATPDELADDPAAQRPPRAHSYQTPIVRELPQRPADPPRESPW